MRGASSPLGCDVTVATPTAGVRASARSCRLSYEFADLEDVSVRVSEEGTNLVAVVLSLIHI